MPPPACVLPAPLLAPPALVSVMFLVLGRLRCIWSTQGGSQRRRRRPPTKRTNLEGNPSPSLSRHASFVLAHVGRSAVQMAGKVAAKKMK